MFMFFSIFEIFVFSVVGVNKRLAVLVGGFGGINVQESRVGALGNALTFADSLIKLIEIYHHL